MERLNTILHELGISKVKLAKYLGVSRQMIYNYLELEDLNKWPKDKKVLLLNLLGIKNSKDLDTIKVDTDYINEVETRMENLLQNVNEKFKYDANVYEGLSKKNRELLMNIIDLIKEDLADNDGSEYFTYLYLYHFIQAMRTSKELRYILSYVAKSACLTKPTAYVFDEDEEFVFESIMFSAMTLYHNSSGLSKKKITELHKRFLKQIEQKKEEKLSRTLELTTYRIRALKELGYTEINEKNSNEVLEKIAEIEARGVI